MWKGIQRDLPVLVGPLSFSQLPLAALSPKKHKMLGQLPLCLNLQVTEAAILKWKFQSDPKPRENLPRPLSASEPILSGLVCDYHYLHPSPDVSCVFPSQSLAQQIEGSGVN